MTEHKIATQAMVLALVKRIERLEAALKAADIELSPVDPPADDPTQTKVDDYLEG